MRQSANPTLLAEPTEPRLQRFLDRALLGLEWGSLAALLLITLVQPINGRTGLPTWQLILLFAAYLLLVELLRHLVRRLHPFAYKYALGVPVSGLIYFLGAEPGGPLFVLFFLTGVCATAASTLRGGLLYTASVAVLTVLIDPTFPGWSPAEGDVRDLGARLILLCVFGVGTAVLRRRLALEQEAAGRARGESERLGEIDRLRDLFISSVSHDLRTPLTATRAGLGLLRTSAVGRLRADERDLLDNARRNIDRLGMLIDDLLAYNQLEAGTLRLDREPLDLRAVVTEAMSSMHPLIQEKGQILEVDLPEPLPGEGDPRRLEQVVVNVLANAYLHTPKGIRIGISGRISGSQVSLSVSDTGPGIPQGELEAIFRRFHRLEPARGGSGLGLAIARGIVELHGGRIRAESRPGAGTTFHIILPSAENGGTNP
ncbi:MAG: HAMP domain-containing histidine kinase [Actinomycetota bacterium]|jgi:signal transduction histidine kinase|nr:HAMP domain-containing histidine kinase [Actinomycetota bacterium]